MEKRKEKEGKRREEKEREEKGKNEYKREAYEDIKCQKDYKTIRSPDDAAEVKECGNQREWHDTKTNLQAYTGNYYPSSKQNKAVGHIEAINKTYQQPPND